MCQAFKWNLCSTAHMPGILKHTILNTTQHNNSIPVLKTDVINVLHLIALPLVDLFRMF